MTDDTYGLISDEQLVQESMNGSNVAFDQLMKRHQKWVYWIAYSWSKNQETALDLSQEIFLQVYKKLTTYRGPDCFRAWLSKIASRVCATWSRRMQNRADSIEFTEEHEVTDSASQESDYEKNQKVKHLMKVFYQLNTRQRLAVAMRYFGMATTREIAQALDCSEGVAKNILFRSVRKLRERLVPTWSDQHEDV